MIEPPVPENEPERLAALRALNVLDTPPNPVIDQLTRDAAQVFDVPMAAVSLIDHDRQWFKAKLGLDASETGRDVSFCGHLVASDARQLVVPDATKDPRFHDNPLVTGELGLRFYAGSKLYDSEGRALGSLCMLDHRPREASEHQLDTLNRMADAVSGALVLDGARADVERLSGIDTLTAALNRRGLERAAARLAHQPAGLLVIGFDRLDRVAAAHGLEGVDEILAEAAQRIARALRRGDQLARITRDLFAVLVLKESQGAMLRRVAERVRALLADPFILGSTAVRLPVSIGIAGSAASDWKLSGLIEAADGALSEAREGGEGRTALADPGRPRAMGRLALADRLRVAIASAADSFHLHYQPVFSLAEGRCVAVEALIRWSVDDKPVSPGLFVPLAEEMGLAPDLDAFVLRKAAEASAHAPRVMVNLSVHTLALPELAALVEAALGATGLEPARLLVEVTETGLATRPEAIGQALDALAAAGIGVALDDFGAGQTSLVQLHRFPLERLKIDGSLVRMAATEPKAHTVLSAIARLGPALGLGVVAEGVETDEQLDMVAGLGIAYAQGFGLARPMAPAALAQSIAAGEARLARRRLSAPAAADDPRREAACG